MIELVFTLDYEIYGSGAGSLRELVYEPMEALRTAFKKWNVRCVVFVEAAELETIDRGGTDPFIQRVKDQVQNLHREGFEIGLHLHPQWYNGRYENGGWTLDESEYNLCTLPRKRIAEIIDRSIAYLRSVAGDPGFTPASFRAGNWLFQPTATVAEVLSERGIRIDSSVFKGGIQRRYGLDYRAARSNGSWWRFSRDVNVGDPHGKMIEVPIFTRMVPFWRMLTARRIGLQQKSISASGNRESRIARLKDYLRFSYPLKLDFCRMTGSELRSMFDHALEKGQKNPQAVFPVVGIGHTKDLVDTVALESFLAHLKAKAVPISRLDDVCARVYQASG